jgi:hypothetical protein
VSLLCEEELYQLHLGGDDRVSTSPHWRCHWQCLHLMCRGKDCGMVCLLMRTSEGGVIGSEVIGRHLHRLQAALIGNVG